VLVLSHALLAPLCNLGRLVKSITSRVAVRACLSMSTLVAVKEAMLPNLQIPPHPPLIKGGWGDFIFTILAALQFLLHDGQDFSVSGFHAASRDAAKVFQ